MRPNRLEYYVSGLGIHRKDHDVWIVEHGHCHFCAQHAPARLGTIPGDTL